MVAWPPIFRRAKELLSEDTASEASGEIPGPTDGSHAFRRQWRRTQLAVLGGAVLLGLFVWWRSGARIPWRSTTPTESTVAPTNPAAAAVGVSPSPRGATNANSPFKK